MRLGYILLSTATLLSGCGGRQADGGDDSQAGSPVWSPCMVEGEAETCTEVCAAEGMACLANQCPAEPESCKPDSCDMATSVLGLGDGICSDNPAGAFVSASCDEPIEFIFNDTARCCCAEEI